MLRLNQSLARFIRKVHCVLQVEQQKFILASLNLNKKKVLNFTFRNKLLEILCFHELKLSKQSCLIVTVLRENGNKGLIFSFFCYAMMRYRKACNSNNNTPKWKLVKTHYRGHHIAVWLQLIPQLHQPNDNTNAEMSPNHHSFEQHNTPADQFYDGMKLQPSTIEINRCHMPPSCPNSSS